MGAYLDKPITKKEIKQASANDFRATVCSMQGWRSTMEDSCFVQCSIPGNEKAGFFGVFDGHGGIHASSFCMDHLLDHLLKQEEYKGPNTTPDDYVMVFKKGYLKFDDLIYKDQLSHRIDHCGTTAITAFVTPTHIICANLGDSRCVLNYNGTAVPLSFDHKPGNEIEYNRIIKAGGTVITGRVKGDLAVARAFGDFSYKQVPSLPPNEQWVIAEPDVKIVERKPGQRYLFFACDGIWDAIPQPQKLVDVLDELLASCENPSDALSDLLELCLDLNSTDNMTVVLVLFDDALKPDPAKVAARLERLQEQENLKNLLNEEMKKQTNMMKDNTPIEEPERPLDADLEESKESEENSKYYVHCKACNTYFPESKLLEHNKNCLANPDTLKRFVNRYESVLASEIKEENKQ